MIELTDFATLQRRPVARPTVVETEAARRDRIARRIVSWLAADPAPADMLDALYQVAIRLDDGLPGGLALVTADVFLDIFCQSLLYCDIDDLLTVWPRLSARQPADAGALAAGQGPCDNGD